MNVPEISFEEVPKGLRVRLRPGEVVHHLTFVKANGCNSSLLAGQQWFIVTSQRVLFGGNVTESVGDGIRQVHESCSLPLPAVADVCVGSDRPGQAGDLQAARLTVSGKGAQIALAFPTREEALRVKGLLDAITPGIRKGNTPVGLPTL